MDSFFLSLLSKAITAYGEIVYFEHEQLDAWVNEIIEKGVKFEQMPRYMSYLWREAILYNPSGNKIQLSPVGENRLILHGM